MDRTKTSLMIDLETRIMSLRAETRFAREMQHDRELEAATAKHWWTRWRRRRDAEYWDARYIKAQLEMQELQRVYAQTVKPTLTSEWPDRIVRLT